MYTEARLGTLTAALSAWHIKQESHGVASLHLNRVRNSGSRQALPPGKLALWRGKQSLQTFLLESFLLETVPETEKRKGGPRRTRPAATKLDQAAF